MLCGSYNCSYDFSERKPNSNSQRRPDSATYRLAYSRSIGSAVRLSQFFSHRGAFCGYQCELLRLVHLRADLLSLSMR